MIARTAVSPARRAVRAGMAGCAVAAVVFVTVLLGLTAAAGSEYLLEPGPWVLLALAAVWIPCTLLGAVLVADRRARDRAAVAVRG